MSPYELRAEHHPGAMARNGRRWHVVRRGRVRGICGLLLSPVGETRPLGAWAAVEHAGRCSACWKVFGARSAAA